MEDLEPESRSKTVVVLRSSNSLQFSWKASCASFTASKFFPENSTKRNPKSTGGTYVTLDSKPKTFEIDPKTLFGVQMNNRLTVK